MLYHEAQGPCAGWCSSTGCLLTKPSAGRSTVPNRCILAPGLRLWNLQKFLGIPPKRLPKLQASSTIWPMLEDTGHDHNQAQILQCCCTLHPCQHLPYSYVHPYRVAVDRCDSDGAETASYKCLVTLQHRRGLSSVCIPVVHSQLLATAPLSHYTRILPGSLSLTSSMIFYVVLLCCRKKQSVAVHFYLTITKFVLFLF